MKWKLRHFHSRACVGVYGKHIIENVVHVWMYKAKCILLIQNCYKNNTIEFKIYHGRPNHLNQAYATKSRAIDQVYSLQNWRKWHCNLLGIDSDYRLGIKPLFESLPCYCYLYHNVHIQMPFCLKFKSLHYIECNWKCHLQNSGHFIRASVYYIMLVWWIVLLVLQDSYVSKPKYCWTQYRQ